jgi:hypothetical protein
MRCIQLIDGNVVELNYMWLPTWIGQNAKLKKEIEEALKSKIVGKDLSEDTLNEVHEMVLQYLVDRFPAIRGLYDYLDGLKFIEDV